MERTGDWKRLKELVRKKWFVGEMEKFTSQGIAKRAAHDMYEIIEVLK